MHILPENVKILIRILPDFYLNFTVVGGGGGGLHPQNQCLIPILITTIIYIRGRKMSGLNIPFLALLFAGV